MEREVHKYFIETINLSAFPKNEVEWTERIRGNACIGYYFGTKDDELIVNLYLIGKKYYHKKEVVSYNEIVDAYAQFCMNCIQYTDAKDYMKRNVFKNPPLEEWFKAKDNWIKKVATKIAKAEIMSFEEAISTINEIVCSLYVKKKVYMGNLNYIETSVWNSLRKHFSREKNKLNMGNQLVVSLFQEVGKEIDDTPFTLEEVIGQEAQEILEFNYNEFEKEVRRVMRTTFSEREMDQIFTQRAGYLPMALYRKLIKWRNNNQDKLKYLRSLI